MTHREEEIKTFQISLADQKHQNTLQAVVCNIIRKKMAVADQEKSKM
jgi:hypothetical protein